MKRLLAFSFLVICTLYILGCGYTTGSLLPPEMDSIRVNNFENKIDPAKEVSDRRMNFFYRPGVETDVTRAVIDAFIFDRHLNIETEKNATLLMKGALVDLKQYPLSYDKGGGIEEYRIEVRVNIELYDNKTGKLLWRENNFMGQSSFNISGPNKQTESVAIKEAVKDLARRIVERTVESW